jgi:adenylosuccinate lyase
MGATFENIPLWHERDLSNSANERFTIPMCSILLDDMLETMLRIIDRLRVNVEKIEQNLYITKGQIFAEFVLEALIKKGVPRFVAYRDVQRVAFEAHDKGMDYSDAIKSDESISSKLTESEIDKIFTPKSHLGAAPQIITNVNNSVNRVCKKFI